MTVQLPEAGSPGSSWELIDYVSPDASTAKTDNTGVGTINFRPVDANRMWQITRAVISCGGNTLPQLRLYVGDAGFTPSQSTLRSGSADGFFDEADYPGEGLWVLEGQQLIAQWTGAQAAQLCTCQLQYRLLGR